jgi:hypothetical protein
LTRADAAAGDEGVKGISSERVIAGAAGDFGGGVDIAGDLDVVAAGFADDVDLLDFGINKSLRGAVDRDLKVFGVVGGH